MNEMTFSIAVISVVLTAMIVLYFVAAIAIFDIGKDLKAMLAELRAIRAAMERKA